MPQPSEPEIEVFNAALELPARERAAYLDKACAGDGALRQRVEQLLQVSEAAGAFLESPAAVPPGPGGTVQLPVFPAEKPGDRIGRYKLLQQIGEGGCGIVYMAEQEEPVRRRVALKVIKLGMDTKSVIARFEAERQALALMDHPNIAKVLDAGATSTGRPYFVMELVRGIKITDYCDQNSLSTKERLDLFIKVCQAIQHAHQKGIIHRDIKLSNILVTVNDGVAVPKVIDFGIAKATQGRLTDHTLFTAFEQFLGTPAYMSPEQAVMTSLDIDTRSDIYSLGVLLYELLTGQTPFDAKKLLQAGLDEMRRTIREQEPARPSTCLSTMLGADLTAIAKSRKAEPPKLIHLVRGDLDWIVMKALEKDRTRRYETANGLAVDIQRHLSNEPVVACPPSNLYKFQKLVRRNKLAFTAASAVAAALVLGVVASTAEAIRAKRAEQQQSRLREVAEQSQRVEAQQRHEAEAERKIAETEAAKSRQVSGFLEEMFRGVSPWVASGRDTTVLREILDKAAGRLSSDLTNQPEVELELRNTIGWVYRELGDARNARAVLLDAPAIARKLWGNDDLRLASSLQNLALATDNLKDAEALQLEVLAIRRKALGNESPEVGISLRDVANVLRMEGRLVEAEKTEREALAIQWKLWPRGDPEVAASLFDLALVLSEEGRWPEAETAASQSLSMYTKMSGEENPDVARSLGELGHVLRSQGKLAEAEPLLRRALAMGTKLYGNENPDVAWILNDLVGLLLAQHKDLEAEQLLGDFLKPTLEGQPQSVGVLRARISFFARRGRWKGAAADLSQLAELDPTNDYDAFQLTVLFVGIGDMADYRAHCRKMAARFGAGNDPGSLDKTAKACLLLPEPGFDLEAACQMADQAVTLGKDSPLVYYFRLVKGLAEYRAGHFASAVDWVGKSIGKPATVGGTSPAWNRDVAAYSVLAMAQHKLKRSDEARATLARGVAIAQTNLPQLDSGDLGEDWADWLIAHILLREAQALIEGPSAPVAEEKHESH